ncbi:TetR/AcrR family transcriptional regulator [Nocardioides pantholopis]|uniref:TetR/AcrR family transcriptional regulator n=1 Tax=Nocardioides pantholopis TaxID=2483798 RepID=UPI000F085C17|nr:TetR/AcrR family transcriptional regulator [Nocardioides pantholopis]
MGRPPGHGVGFEARREEIIDLAAQLFAEQGYAATGTAELGRRVGLAKGALYHYIGSKEDLLVAIQERVLTPLVESARAVSGLGLDPVLRLRFISDVLMETILGRLDYIWVYEHDYRHLGSANKERFRGRRREFESIIQTCIAEAVEAGTFRRNIDPRLATLQFLNLHNHTYQWIKPGGTWSAADLSAAYCETLFRGWGADVDTEAMGEQVDRLRHLSQWHRGPANQRPSA